MNDVRVPVPKVANNSDILSRYGHIMQAPGVTLNHAHGYRHVVLRAKRAVLHVPIAVGRGQFSLEVLAGVHPGVSKLESGVTHYYSFILLI